MLDPLRVLGRRRELVDELAEFLRIPSVRGDLERAREASEWLAEAMERWGIRAGVVETGGAPVVLGEAGDGSRTVLLYAHYDVQPPGEGWETEPFKPVERGGRVYARGASDDKGPLLMAVQAVGMMLEEGELPVRVLMLFEGEEEMGSPHLKEFLEARKDRLSADCALCLDIGAVLDDGTPLVELGLKGILFVDVFADSSTREGVPDRPRHSGFSPVLVNPCWLVVEALSSLVREGRVALESFYDRVRPLSRYEEELIRSAAYRLAGLLESKLGTKLEDPYEGLRRLVGEPVCNICAVLSFEKTAAAGEPCVSREWFERQTTTVVPSWCMAKVDFRLVPDQDPEEVYRLVAEALKGVGVRVERRASLPPYRLPADHWLAAATLRAVKAAFRVDPCVLPSAAGSGGMVWIPIVLGVPMSFFKPAAYGVAHAPNEYIRVDDYLRGIVFVSAFLEEVTRGGPG